MRRLIRILALIATLAVGAAALVLIVSQTAWFRDWLRGYVVRQANEYLRAELSIGRLSGNLFFGLELEDIALTLDGDRVIAVRDIGLDYSALDFVTGGIVLDDIRINQPVVRLVREDDGWNLGRLLKEQRREADREGPARPVSIGEIGITDGTVTIAGMAPDGAVDVPSRVDRINARLGFEYEPVRYTADIGHLSFRTADPELALNDLAGRLAVAEDNVFVEGLRLRMSETSLRLDAAVRAYQQTPVIEATASSDKVALNELARLVPALRGYELQPAFELGASGPLDRLKLHADVRTGGAGDLRADVVADLAEPQRGVAGTIEMRDLDLAPILRDPERPSDITGRAEIDLRLVEGASGLAALDGTWRIDAPSVAVMGYAARDVAATGRFDGGVIHLDGRAAAYGGRATARGTIQPEPRLALDLEGNAAGVDLRNLPRAWGVPGTPGRLNVSYRLRGHLGERRDRDLAADVAFQPSVLAGAAIAGGSTARVRIAGERIGYAADVRVAGLDLEQMGRGLGIEALADERFRTSLTGHVAAEGAGTSVETLELTARGTLEDSAVFGGRLPSLTFDASIADGDLQVAAAGAFAGFDPAVLAERPEIAGEVQGELDVELTLRDLGTPIDPEAVSAKGRVNLGESRIGGIALERVAVRGDYDRGAGRIDALDVVSPDFTVSASGPLDLRQEGGGSDLELRADLGRLSALAALADQPLEGSAQIEGRVTGNGSALAVDGALQASNVSYEAHTVLSATMDYAVRLPDLAPADAEVSVNGRATLLEIAGRQLTALDLDATWQHPSVRFRTTISEAERSVTAAGDVILHPDHQELHFTDLALRTTGPSWETPSGAEAAIRYGGGRIEIDNLHLVSGAQQISAAGSLGAEGDRLHVSAQNVDIAALDELALGEDRFGGTLTANATIQGTFDAPQLEATLGVRDGSFRQYRYESLGGDVRYTHAGVQLDVRLAQSPGAWITAQGFVPAALFRPAAAEGAERVPAADARPLDVTVRSSEIDLAVIQGFVPQLSRVSGSLQAEVRATGSAEDPHMTGYVEIRNGAFTVADLTKGGYTGLDTRILLQPDHVAIDRLRILDEHRNWIEVDGQIAVHERQVGQVQLAIRSSGFEIIDNPLADIKVDTDLRVTGRLQQPRVEGRVGVSTGTVRLDRIFADLVTDAYDLAPTEIEAAPQTAVSPSEGATAVAQAGGSPRGPAGADEPGNGEEDDEPTGTIFEALALDVELAVPNNLVVRGTNLNPGGTAPIGLGDVNVTLGGEIRARKNAGDPDVAVLGTVNTVRGTYDFQGRRFEIERDGRIQFTGGTPIDPRLDITARRLIAGVEALVNVRGTARAPELHLSSRPPLTEADILSLIIFNQPVNSLGEGQQVSLAERAGALATGFVASSLAQSISGALELDIFEIQTSPEAGGGGTLTVGEQVGERLFIRFRQGFGAQAMSEFILEYQLADFLRLQTSLAEGNSATRRSLVRRVEQGGIDLIFFFSY